MRLEGKTAFVTGGGAGMGRAIVEEFVAEGARVYTNDIDTDRLEALRRVPALSQGQVVARSGDLASPEDIARMAAEATEELGHVDIIVNNAGIYDYLEPAVEVSLATWNRVFAVNVTSHFLLAQALLPGMVERGSGAIVSIASAAGLVGGGGGVAYTMSKHAVIGLARQLALEFGPHGIRVNTICPGIVQTPLLQSAIDAGTADGIKAFAGMTASRRVGDPREIARAAVFLASGDASFMFGSVVSVDGGYTLF